MNETEIPLTPIEIVDGDKLLAQIHAELEGADINEVTRRAASGDITAMIHLEMLTRKEQEANPELEPVS